MERRSNQNPERATFKKAATKRIRSFLRSVKELITYLLDRLSKRKRNSRTSSTNA
jgi:hypothetical protein